MKLILPVAGYGKRMRPHTWSRPKVLIDVAGKPMLGHVLDQFSDVGLDEVIYITGWLGEQIKPYVEANYPQFGAQFVVQEELVGQSHAIWLAREHISGPCFIVFADTITRIDLQAMAATDADGVLGVWEVDDPRRFGIAFTRPDGTVERCVEKPATADHKLAIMGTYFVREGRDLIAAIEEQMARDQMLQGRVLPGRRVQPDAGARRPFHHRTDGRLAGLRGAGLSPGDQPLAAGKRQRQQPEPRRAPGQQHGGPAGQSG